MISIIIPVRNEEDTIASLLKYLQTHAPNEEIILVDGGSSDETVKIASNFNVTIIKSLQGRAHQMNEGAKMATGNILYFLHADSFPPKDFVKEIQSQLTIKDFGFFRIRFDPSHYLINIVSFIGKLNTLHFVFGDRSLFVKRESFKKVNGFLEDHIVMEDNNILHRLNKTYKPAFSKKIIRTSSRKYFENGVARVQAIYVLIYLMYHLGFSQKILVQTYKKLIRSKQYD